MSRRISQLYKIGDFIECRCLRDNQPCGSEGFVVDIDTEKEVYLVADMFNDEHLYDDIYTFKAVHGEGFDFKIPCTNKDFIAYNAKNKPGGEV